MNLNPPLEVGRRVRAVFAGAPRCDGRVVEVRRAGSRRVSQPGEGSWIEPGALISFVVVLDAPRLGRDRWELPAECYKGAWGQAAATVAEALLGAPPEPPGLIMMPCSAIPVISTGDDLEDGELPRPAAVGGRR